MRSFKRLYALSSTVFLVIASELPKYPNRGYVVLQENSLALDKLLLHLRNYSRFAIRNGKKSPNQETGFGNRGHLKVMNDTKLVLNEH